MEKADTLINRCFILPMNGHDLIEDGELLMENRHVRILDEQADMEKAGKAASNLLSR